jgi:hypothetical protein
MRCCQHPLAITIRRVKVTFPKLPSGSRSYCVVERADHVCYRVDLGVCGERIPHDLVHLVAERSLEESGGFWGAVADGAVFVSMRHLGGRRPPHAERRSRNAIAARKDRLTRAELVAGLVEKIATANVRDDDAIRRMTAEMLSTQRDDVVSPTRLRDAADRLVDTQAQWSSLDVGEELVLIW